MSYEHPVEQTIKTAVIYDIGDNREIYIVGMNGVTRIEACTKSGMHADIPYIRIWRDDSCLAEFCQHNIQGVYFGEVEDAG